MGLNKPSSEWNGMEYKYMLTDAHLPVSYPDVRYAYHPFEPVLADCCQLC